MGDDSDPPDILDRIRSWARHHASGQKSRDHHSSSPQDPVLPISSLATSEKDAQPQRPSSRPTTSRRGHDANGRTHNTTTNGDTSTSSSPPASNTDVKSEDEGAGGAAIEQKTKPPMAVRFPNAMKRGWLHTREALTHSWVNVLLIFVPAGIAVKAAGLSPAIVFALNAIAIIPLAGLLTHATESVADRLGDTLGALLNVSFGNAVELIIFIIALVKNEIRIVQASLLGSILSNLLLILGMAFLLGGLRFQEQIYNSTVTQMSACLLSLAVMSLLLPTAFHASFSDSADADDKTLKISRGTSIILLVVYILYLLFQLKSHSYMYESTPQHIIDEESHPGILAEMLESSSSSSDSDTTASSDTDTSGSHTTTKRRIKRAFKNRVRRKSSASSTTAPSVPSAVSSPSTERAGGFLDPTNLPPSSESRQPSVLGAIASGDEADTDGEQEFRRAGEPRVRDFVGSAREEAVKEKERKKDKKHKKHRKHHHHHHEKTDDAEPSTSRSRKNGKKPVGDNVSDDKSSDGPQVGFAEDVRVVEMRTGMTSKKSFGLRQLPTRQSLRPALPKMLSQNVFVTPPPRNTASSIVVQPAPKRTTTDSSGLRRTSSLPDRLNRQETPTGTRQENLPPYPRAGQRATRVLSMRSNHDEPADADVEDKPLMSRTSAAVLLLISTGLVAVCAEFLVDAIPGMISSTPVGQTFIGLILLPIVSNAAEHVTAVTVATKNKMDLAIGVAVGSSIQIAIFVTPLVVILGWMIGRDMTLYFNLFETVCLFVTAFVVNFLVLDGRSNYLEGSLLMAAYCIIA